MKESNARILSPWSSEDRDTVEDDVEEDREEARRVLRKKRFNMELLCAIIEPERTRNEIVEEVKRCMKNGASFEARCQEELVTAAHVAALYGEDDILRVLLEAGADPSTRDRCGRQPHHLAAVKGHLSTLLFLIDNDRNLINSQVLPEETEVDDGLLDSNIHNHSEITSQLPIITEGSTALHIASRCGFIEIVDFLLENNAKTDIKDCQQNTPLDVAGIDADLSIPGTIACAAILAEDISHDSVVWSPKQKDSKSFLKSFLPSKKKRKDKEKSHIMELFTAFSKTGITLSTTDLSDKKVTLLHTAVRKEDTEAIKELIEKGFKLNTLDEKERTPVHLAVELYLIESLNILLESDCCAVNYKDGKGRTPLHVAVEYEWKLGVQVLLEQKTDLRIVSKNGETVLHVAARKGNPQLLKTLLQRFNNKVIHKRDNEGYTPLFRAVEKGNIDCVDMLLQDPNDPNFKKYIKKATDTSPSATLLHVAVTSNAPIVLEKLIQVLNPCDTYLNFWNDKGYSALHLAAEKGHTDCVKILLATKGIRLDLLSDIEERSALHFAAQSGNRKIAEILLEECSHYNEWNEENQINLLSTPDKDGREPLLLAVNGGHRDCSMFLLSKGANLAARDGPAGSTALDIVYYKMYQPVQMLGDLMDIFMERVVDDYGNKEDNPDLKVKLNFTTLLADVKNHSRQLGVIDAINNSEHEQLQQKLFLHPLVESFLFLKWKQLKYFFKILVMIYIIHIISLTGVATMTYAYHLPVVAWICRVIVLMTLIPIICWELLNASRFEKFYLTDGETWIKWSVIFTTGLVTVLPELHWARYLTSVSVLLAWIELLFLYARTFTWGLIVQMFIEVAKNVVEVFTTFLFLILGFAFAFLVLFDERYPFTDLWTSLCKVLVMMVELDYSNAFPKEEKEFTAFNVIGRLMYIGFVILVIMVLINLIQSMSVNDVAKLEAQGRSKRLAKKASFLSLLESFCYNENLLGWLPKIVREKIENKRSVPAQLLVSPNKLTSPDNPLPEKLRLSILQTVFNRDAPYETDTLNNKVEQLVSDMEKIFDMVREIKEGMLQLQESFN